MHSYFADTTVHYKVLSYKSPIIQKDHVKTVVHSHMVLYAFFSICLYNFPADIQSQTCFSVARYFLSL